MTKYRVTFVQTVYEACDVLVEADSEGAAKAAATAIVTEQSRDPEKPEFTWKFCEAEGDAEIVAVEEWPPAPFDPLPEGVTLVSLDDPVELHNTIADAVGEPRMKRRDR
jgi:hypothetical protein